MHVSIGCGYRIGMKAGDIDRIMQATLGSGTLTHRSPDDGRSLAGDDTDLEQFYFRFTRKGSDGQRYHVAMRLPVEVLEDEGYLERLKSRVHWMLDMEQQHHNAA